MKIVSINHNSRIPVRTVDDSPLVGEWDGKEHGIIITSVDPEHKRTVHVILTKDDINEVLCELQRLAMKKRDVPSPASDWIILRQQQVVPRFPTAAEAMDFASNFAPPDEPKA